MSTGWPYKPGTKFAETVSTNPPVLPTVETAHVSVCAKCSWAIVLGSFNTWEHIRDNDEYCHVMVNSDMATPILAENRQISVTELQQLRREQQHVPALVVDLINKRLAAQ